MSDCYRSLFVGTLVQDSFLSLGGTDDPFTTVDGPFCLDGLGRPTLRGSGLAGALVATLRRLMHGAPVPPTISGSPSGRDVSVWRFFNSHPWVDPEGDEPKEAHRQHVSINHSTGASASGALFNLATLPPETCWPFLLEVDTSRDALGAELARDALRHWAAGRCLLGREVARGLGWMHLRDLREYALTTEHADYWPCAGKSVDYRNYISTQFQDLATDIDNATEPLPGWFAYDGQVNVGLRDDGYGIDSLSIGGHASEEIAAAWDERFLGPDGMRSDAAVACFDPDFAVVTWERRKVRVPYIPGSSLRGPLRHALSRLLRARGETSTDLVDGLFGTAKRSARLLIRDALPTGDNIQFAWLQHHAEDEFAGGAYSSSKFDRVAVIQGSFALKMVLEDPQPGDMLALAELLALARTGQIGIGGGQWRGHGWARWQIENHGQPRVSI